MKKKGIISLIAAVAMISAQLVPAYAAPDTEEPAVISEEESKDIFANIKTNEVKEAFKNSVALMVGSCEAYVFGEKILIGDNEGERVYEKGDGVYAPSSLINNAFSIEGQTGGYEDIYKTAKDNGLTVTNAGGVIFISKGYVPRNIPSAVGSFFGIFVSPGKNGTGKYDSPAGSIASAKAAAYEAKRSVGLPMGGINIYLMEGIYPITDVISFNSEEGGMEGSPITFKAYNGAKVSFNGGISVKGSDFGDVTDTNMLSRLPDPDKIACVDISGRLSGFADTFKSSDPGQWAVSYRDQALTVCRWPDRVFARTGEVLEAPSDWRNNGFRFVVDDTRIKNWVGEDDPRIFGYFCFRWAGEFRRISEVRTGDLSIKSDRGAEYGILADKEYYVYNLVSELDSPGEFYFDKKNNMLYIYPVEGNKKDPQFLQNSVDFALLSQNMFELNGCNDICFSGITFENALGRIVVMSPECRNITFKGCTFKNISNGIIQRGFNNLITGCDFYNITANPVEMDGGDRPTLTLSGSVITNCRFHDFNTVTRTNCAAIKTVGCGDLISHNEIVGGPHTVISIGGNENIIEYNELFDNLTDHAEDAAPLYGGRNLSQQNNMIRYNYFHDLPPSMGVIYFDDVLSNMHAHDNVFINTPRALFVHGGVSNTLKHNLVINSSSEGAAIRTSGQSGNYWITSNAQSDATNIFMYRLMLMPYKSKPWQKYSDVFRHIDAYIGQAIIPTYDCEFTDNTFVNLTNEYPETEGIEAIGDNVRPYIKIEGNKVISGEEAKNFVIPEYYRNIMDKAGIYKDDDRKELDTLGSFELVRPYDKSSNVEASQVVFEWSAAENANKYLFTLSTDKDFKNIISNKYVSVNSVTIDKLNYYSTRYYWKVTAIPKQTNSMLSKETKGSKSAYFSFTTKAAEKINTSKLDDIMEVSRGKISAVVEGDAPGQYVPGTLDMINELYDRYEKQKTAATVTQRAVNEMAVSFKADFERLINRRNKDYTDMYSLISSANKWSITPNQFIAAPGYIKYTTKSSSVFGTAEKIPVHEILKYKALFSSLTDTWVGFAIRAQASPTAVAWSGNSQYLVIIKESTLEFQKWGDKNILEEYPNTYVKAGETHEYEYGAENMDDGSVRVTFKIDGNTVIEYNDTDNPISGPGFFEVYGGAKDTYIELTADEPEGKE